MSSEEHSFWQRAAEIKLKIKSGNSSQAYRSSLSSSTRLCFGNPPGGLHNHLKTSAEVQSLGSAEMMTPASSQPGMGE